jgi:hypothetical protein
MTFEVKPQVSDKIGHRLARYIVYAAVAFAGFISAFILFVFGVALVELFLIIGVRFLCAKFFGKFSDKTVST